jgi:hypothetical protein
VATKKISSTQLILWLAACAGAAAFLAGLCVAFASQAWQHLAIALIIAGFAAAALSVFFIAVLGRPAALNPLGLVLWLTALLGAVAFVAGQILGAVTEGWLTFCAALIFGGFVVAVVSLLLNIGTRRASAIINTAFLVYFAFIIVIVINYVNSRHFKRFDWTAEHHHQLTSQTLNIITNLDAKHRVSITTLFILMDAQQAGIFSALRDLLEEYRYNSSNIEVHHIDPITDRITAQKLKEQVKTSVNELLNTVVLQCGDRSKVVPMRDLLEMPQTPDYNPYMAREPPKFKGEDAITSAILAVAQEKQPTIYFTTGHGERDFDDFDKDMGMSQFGKILRRDNYKLEKLNLSTKKQVPEDCDLLVIAGPAKTFREDEVAALRQYLARNGKLMVMLQPKLASGGAPSGLEALLAEYNIKANSDFMILNKVQDILGRVAVTDQVIVQPDTGYPPGKITDKIRNQNTIFPAACQVDSAMPETEGAPPGAAAGPYRVSPLCKSADSSWGETDINKPDENKGVKGPFSLAVSVQPKGPERPNPYGGPPMPNPDENLPGPRLVVFGSVEFAANSTVKSFGNQDLIMNAVAWLAAKESQMGISAKPFEDRPINVSPAQLRTIFIFVFLLLPEFGVIAGVVVWFVRRK